MNHRDEVRDFVMSRRARVTPDRVGLPAGHNRRVTGLRRSEVATLPGLSVEYDVKIERGNIDGASEQVLDAIARALQLLGSWAPSQQADSDDGGPPADDEDRTSNTARHESP